MTRLPLMLCLVLSFTEAYAEPVNFTGFPAWQHAVADLHQYPVLREKRLIRNFDAVVKKANGIVNGVDQVSDDDLVYGKRAYWATETEFVNFSGQCRDFALEKYRLLRRVGVGMRASFMLCCLWTMASIRRWSTTCSRMCARQNRWPA
jgi:predicted transglutaminase-like cysteine proteinase